MAASGSDDEVAALTSKRRKNYCSINDGNEITEESDGNIARRPFHYSGGDATSVNNDISEESIATFWRYRYYTRLASPSDNTLRIPEHVIPSSFFYQLPSSFTISDGKKQSSIITIFALWNTMLGTSMLSLPWALERAGFACGLVLLAVMAGISLYTAFLIIKLQRNMSDSSDISLEFSDMCRILLGPWAEWASIIFSLSSLLGAVVVYWVLMSNFLYNNVRFIYEHVGSYNSTVPVRENYSDVYCPHPVPFVNSSNIGLIKSDYFNKIWTVDASIPLEDEEEFNKVWTIDTSVPLFLIILVGPLINFKSPTFFTKFNALGTCSVVYVIIFVITKAVRWGLHIDFSNKNQWDYIPLYKNSFPELTGTLALAYFIHNCVLSVMKTQKNPEKNGRDLSIAYILVAVTYAVIGGVFYLSFPLYKICIEDNFLSNFRESDIMTFVSRLFLLFQMITVFPLLLYIFRIQLMYILFGSIYPSLKHIIALNALLVTIGVLFAIYLPHVGTIIRFTGAFCGLAYTFTLPCLTHMAYLHHQKQLTWYSTLIHSSIISLGFANFVAQFFFGGGL